MSKKSILILGDIAAFVVLVVIGFATHDELDPSFLPRMAIVFFPLVIAWILLAPWMGLFEQEITSNPVHLWRPAFVMIFAASLAVIVRGLILGAPIIPIFAAVLGGTSALGMLIWRSLYFLLNRKN